MSRLAAESLLHGLITTSAVAAILAAGRISNAKARLRLWLLAIAGPVVFTPLAAVLAPARLSETFRDEWSLFSGSHFSYLRWHDSAVLAVIAYLLAGAGLIFFLLDGVPLLLDLARSRKRQHRLAPIPDTLIHAVARATATMGGTTPGLVVLASSYPLLSCRGWRSPRIVTSIGLLDRLNEDELDAAIAHEVAHARRRDPALGWVLMVVRGLFLFNPCVQLCARAVARELEFRADEDAAAASGGPAPVVRSLRKLVGDEHAHTYDPRPRHGFELAAIEARCRVLLEGRYGVPIPRWALPATALGLGVILFFTVA